MAGHANHSLFWTVMGPKCGGEPAGDLAQAITKDLGSFASFKEQFTKAATHPLWQRLGLAIVNKGKLAVESTANQDSPLSGGPHSNSWPRRLGARVLPKYQNQRPDYITAFWNVVNWGEVGKRFAAAK